MTKAIGPSSTILLFFFTFLFFSIPSFSNDDSGNDDSDTIRISKIKINGNKDISTKKIKENIATETPSIKPWVKKPEFDEEILKDDIMRIQSLYNNNGYYDAKVEYELEYNKEGNMVDITIKIDEGKPVILTEFNLDYQKIIGEKTGNKILKLIPIKVNKVFSADKYENTKNVILDVLSDEGYPKAEIKGEALVDRKKKWAKASFIINPGLLYRFGSTSIEGNDKVKKKLITREILYKKGDIFSESKIDDTQAQIFQLGMFRSVLIDTLYNDEEEFVDIVIRVSERKFGSVKIGAGFGTEDKLRGQIIWTQRNLFGTGRTLRTSAKASFITQRLETELIQPYIIGRNSEFSTLLNLSRDDVPSFKGTSLRNTTRLSKSFKKIYNAFGSFNIQYSKIESSTKRTPEEESLNNVFLTFFNFVFDRSTVNNVLDPTRGSFISLGLEPSFRALASDVNYLKGIIDLRGYKSISEIVFAARLNIGVIQPFSPTGTFDIPIFKRFFAGGSNSMRGFPFQKLGPLNNEGDPLGGNSLIVGSLETRFPIFKDLRGVVFFDYGNIYAKEWDFRLGDLKYAPGVGLRYDTPIGPIRFDVGYALNPEPEFSRTQFWISIGQAF